ncbi:MAG: hypothetical protein J5858_03295 [Lentisphaeria bacterium]|nr:hypothetical protein [Lentisphaeria bacterium]
MDGYTIQTHSVYRDKRSGTRLLLVHHDPMTLRSLLLHGDSAAFATADPQPFSVDMIIAMRRSDDSRNFPGCRKMNSRQSCMT